MWCTKLPEAVVVEVESLSSLEIQQQKNSIKILFVEQNKCI